MEIRDNATCMVSSIDIIPQRKAASFDNLDALKFSVSLCRVCNFMRKFEAKF